MKTLPPGQSLTRKFPVVGEKQPPPQALDLDGWTLELVGSGDHKVALDYDEVLGRAQDELIADIHCVTSWSQLGMRFTGVRLADLLSHTQFKLDSAARFVRFEAWSERNHDTSLPLDIALADSWLIHSFNGEPLTVSRGYPLRVVTPSRYFYKSLKWLRRISFIESDRLGFWERTSGYHNMGDPWREERLEGSRFATRQQADAFRQLTDFSTWRMPGGSGPKVIVKADFQNWCPSTTDLTGLHLKACDFRGARLDDVDFTGANLTLGKFGGASLRNADFTRADLEGADFCGADLSGARFARNLLSATTFATGERSLLGSEGMTMIEPEGLLESQSTYLVSLGILSLPELSM